MDEMQNIVLEYVTEEYLEEDDDEITQVKDSHAKEPDTNDRSVRATFL